MKLRSLGITLLVTLGVFVLGALLMNFVVMPLVIHKHHAVIVPDVSGMSEQQARRFLERVSLHLDVERSDYDVEVPEGYVVSQRPRPNDTIKQGRDVEVVMSLGPRTQRVPDLKGLSLRQGRLLLARQKLRTGRVARILQAVETRETVLACSPPAGKEVTEEEAVDLLVSAGGRPKRYIMPDLSGQDLLFIKEKLENSGFRISAVRYSAREDVYPNTILGQTPEPGSMIREGDSIELVAAGSE
jgi:beta-lactam-binding protein with PASTA domain